MLTPRELTRIIAICDTIEAASTFVHQIGARLAEDATDERDMRAVSRLLLCHLSLEEAALALRRFSEIVRTPNNP